MDPSQYGMKEMVMTVAIGGASLAVAYSLASVIGDLTKGSLTGESVINLVIASALLYLSMNYEIVSVIYGWILLLEVIFAGYIISRSKHHKK